MEDKYSLSEISVFVNGSLCAPVEGIYTIGALAENSVITLGGLELDSYVLNFIAPDGVSFIYDTTITIMGINENQSPYSEDCSEFSFTKLVSTPLLSPYENVTVPSALTQISPDSSPA